MNCILDLTTEDVPIRYHSCTDSLALDDAYATAPMAALKAPGRQVVDEEEVYSAFEQAISGRLEPIQQRLQALSDPALYTPRTTKRSAAIRSTKNWQRSLLFGCLALILMLLGFDFMGLLVLFVH